MNIQTHHSGLIPGQVPNQTGTMRGVPSADSEYLKTRRYMQGKIWEFLNQRRPQSHDQVPTKKMMELVKRLEEALFRSATMTEEYLNLVTLEDRLLVLIKRIPTSNHSQQFSPSNSSSSIGTTIPTPGLQQTVNSSGAAVDSSVVSNNSSNIIGSSTASTGNFVPNGSGSSGNMHGGSFGSFDETS